MTLDSVSDRMESAWPKTFDEMLERARNKTPEQRLAEREARDQAEFAAWQDQRRTRAVELCRKLSEIGPRFETRRFENFTVDDGNRDGYVAAREVADAAANPNAPSIGAYLWSGEPGIGKTHLAGAIVNDCVERGTLAVFTTGVGLLMRIRDSYNRRGAVKEGELDIIDRLISVRLLALDDVGTENFTPDTGRLLYALINGRYERNLGMVVTSNLSLSKLGMQWAKSGVEEHVGRKLIDRLMEMCSLKVELTGYSHRCTA